MIPKTNHPQLLTKQKRSESSRISGNMPFVSMCQTTTNINIKLSKNVSEWMMNEWCVSYMQAWWTPQQSQCSSLPGWIELLSPDHRWRPDTAERQTDFCVTWCVRPGVITTVFLFWVQHFKLPQNLFFHAGGERMHSFNPFSPHTTGHYCM